MPINPSALGVPEPEEQSILKKTESPPLGAPAPEKAKRARRKKHEMIADAVIPADDDQVEIKDVDTGAKIPRPWLVALEMVRDGKATFADTAMKYAMLKYDQQKAAPVFQSDDAPATSMSDPEQLTDEEKDRLRAEHEEKKRKNLELQDNLPPDAEVGDEVRVGSDTYRVGHGRRLVQGDKLIADKDSGDLIHAKRRWQRELGTGAAGPWEYVSLSQTHVHMVENNGKGDSVKVETERLPRTQEALDDGTIKIGTGILEKIGMPQVEQFASASQFQVGPITMSRTVLDDGRRTTVTLADGRKGEVIAAAIEGFELLDNTVEFVAARFRGQLHSFLESTGARVQPVAADAPYS